MDVRNCKSCGRLFNYLAGPPICDACKGKLEDKFQEVKEYVREHREAPINDVSETCEVSIKQIKQWIREERLVLSEESGVFVTCENCGAPIRTGRFCDNCKGKIQGDLRSAYSKQTFPEPSQKKDKNGNKMRFLDL